MELCGFQCTCNCMFRHKPYDNFKCLAKTEILLLIHLCFKADVRKKSLRTKFY